MLQVATELRHEAFDVAIAAHERRLHSGREAYWR